jgi:hypothetical protein
VHPNEIVRNEPTHDDATADAANPTVEPTLPPDASEDEKCRAYIASLHLRPGEPIPEDFEPCPVCEGEGCPSCDERGRVHPARVGWLEDHLLRITEPVLILERILDHPGLPRPALRHREWFDFRAAAANNLMDYWLEEGDPGLLAILEEARSGRAACEGGA